MSAAREVKQLVERLLQLTDGGLVVREGDGDREDPMPQAVRALQVKVDDLDQHMGALKVQQLQQQKQGGAPRASGGDLKVGAHDAYGLRQAAERSHTHGATTSKDPLLHMVGMLQHGLLAITEQQQRMAEQQQQQQQHIETMAQQLERMHVTFTELQQQHTERVMQQLERVHMALKDSAQQQQQQQQQNQQQQDQQHQQQQRYIERMALQLKSLQVTCSESAQQQHNQNHQHHQHFERVAQQLERIQEHPERIQTVLAESAQQHQQQQQRTKRTAPPKLQLQKQQKQQKQQKKKTLEMDHQRVEWEEELTEQDSSDHYWQQGTECLLTAVKQAEEGSFNFWGLDSPPPMGREVQMWSQ
ncbi:hypothetical protein FOA52_016171 [Chlamydomonas sp. UWO 241]|nr:hypothetical protein FOA52_016171 [Chlamydomonas sp. UWO 241]